MPTLCQVEVDSGVIRESFCPERACIVVVILLVFMQYSFYRVPGIQEVLNKCWRGRGVELVN